MVVGETAESQQNLVTEPVTPEQVHPFARLQVVEAKKARPKGASIIATSSPEKQKLEAK